MKTICRSAFLVVACWMLAGLAALAAENVGEDWPQFLGPRANGTSLETGLLEKWPKEGPPMLWEKAIGSGYSAPSVRENLLILHHRLRDEEIVQAMDAVTGREIWKYAYPSMYIDPYGYNNGPRCTPLLTSNRCYTFGAEGKLLCLDLATGKRVWQRDTAKDWVIPPAFFGVGSTPILEQNLLLVMVGGQPNSGMVAFDPESGKTVWESVGAKNWEGVPMTGWPGERTVRWEKWEKQASYSTPVAATVNGQRQIFCLMRQGLVSLDPKSGEVHSSFWFRAQVPESVNAANPVVIDDTVLLSAAYYRIGSVLLKPSPDNKSFTQLWRSPVLEIHWNTPIYRDGYLYAFSGRNEPDAHFRCVELKTGKLMWDRDEKWPGHAPRSLTYGRGSAILAEEKLIVLGETGILGLFKATPEKDEEISRFQVPSLNYPCWAGPILSRKKLYLRSEKQLVCYRLAR